MDNQPAAPITTPAPIPAARPWFRLASLARLEALGQLPPASTAPAASAAPTAPTATRASVAPTSTVPAPPIPRPIQAPAPPPPAAPVQVQAQPSPPREPSPRLPMQVQPSPARAPSPRVMQVQPSTPRDTITNGAPLVSESQQAPRPQALISTLLPAPPPPSPQTPIQRALSRSPTPPVSPKVASAPRSRTPPESPRIRQLPPIKAPPPSDSPRIRQLQPIKTAHSPVAHPEPEPHSQMAKSIAKNNFTNSRGTPSPPKREIETHKAIEAHKGTGTANTEWKKNKKKVEDEGEMKMITMAGDNMGAYMELGTQHSQHINPRQLHGHGHGHGHHKAEESHGEDGKGKKEKGKKKTEAKPIDAVVNSNVQSVNNSIVLGSSCTQQSPGVHMAILRGKQEPKHKGEAHN